MQQFIVVDYCVSEKFVIPKGINLKDEKQVERYWVKYNCLYIELTNGEIVKVESQGWINSFDYKYPMNDEIDVEIQEEECEDEEEYVLGDLKFRCEKCIPCFESGRDTCKGCAFDFSVYNKEEEECEEDVQTPAPAPAPAPAIVETKTEYAGTEYILVKRIVINNELYLISKGDDKTLFDTNKTPIGVYDEKNKTICHIPKNNPFYDKEDQEEEEEEKFGICVLCESTAHKNDICGHNVADGVCCECPECHKELEEEEPEEFVCQRCDLVFEEGSEAEKEAYIEDNEVYCKECKDWLDKETDCGEAGTLNYLLGLPMDKFKVSDE